ncbi:DUF2236 domain-containing protein [Mucilaginibacter robiniae]|uniref:DUF2236 domain-containing protein n=1 Tax=Mucilaginibacter robiniae TaxID=2728022 RepID=A0A7L5E3B4_9SPHI|nr:oxygenase MpaB family protein [Mucilaginibacter robiniae]QJD94826.1 DUF2236 domain-containing protein [Mucilaginibacter robiniae]
MEEVVVYSDDFLSTQRLVADPVVDTFITHTFANDQDKTALRNYLDSLKANHQLDVLPTAYANETLFAQAKQLPPWADKRQMQRGAAFFARHASLVLNMLGLLSLPYDYAGANGAMVLYLSKRLRNDAAMRLQETGQFVWDVMAPNAFAPEGKGFISILKVRLIHATARYYTLKTGQWDDTWGVPVNQEDMAGTNLSFSLLVIRGLRKLDLVVSYDDQQAFMHLWNVVSYLSGVQDSLLPQTGKQAIALAKAIQQHQFRASEQGRALTQSLIEYFQTVKLQSPLTAQNIVQLMRYLLGNEIADLLAIPAGEVSQSVLNLLKISGTLQALKPQWSVNQDYLNQYAAYKKQQEEWNS